MVRLDWNGTEALGAPARLPEPAAEPRKAAEGVEGMFLRMLLDQMLPKEAGGLFGSGPASGMIRGLFLDGVGTALARGRALGIADLVEKTLARDAIADAKALLDEKK